MLTEKEQKILDEAPDWASHYMISRRYGGGYASLQSEIYYDRDLGIDMYYDLDKWVVSYKLEDLRKKAKPSLVNTTHKNPVCKGSLALGSGCGTCGKCVAEKINNLMKTESTGFVTGGIADTNHFPDYNSTQKLPETVYNTKPPLGLRPRFLWLEARKKEITEALQRQLSAGEDLNSEWVDELKEVNEMIKEGK